MGGVFLWAHFIDYTGKQFSGPVWYNVCSDSHRPRGLIGTKQWPIQLSTLIKAYLQEERKNTLFLLFSIRDAD